MTEAEPEAPAPAEPLRDLRLWAGTALLGALAVLADMAFGTLAPGRAPPAAALGFAAAAVAAGNLGPALHPRARRWIEAGNVPPPALPLLGAALLAPPALGPRLVTFGFTLAVLLFCWQRSAALVRSAVRLALHLPEDGSGARGEAAPPGGARRVRRSPVPRGARPFDEFVAAAVLDALLVTAAALALCDLGAGRAAGRAEAGARILLSAVAGAAALGLVAWAGRVQVLRRAEAEEAGLQPGFSRLWWWAVVPALCLCLLCGLALPPYPAPLQGGGLGRLVVGFVEVWTGPGGARPAVAGPGPGGGAVLGLTAAGLALVLLLAWPLRAVVERAFGGAARPGGIGPPLGLWSRLRLWWGRLLRGRRDRRPRRDWASGSWRPAGAPPPVVRPGPPPPVPPPSPDVRLRVRAAYERVLRDAAATGVPRRAHETPRGFLAALLRRGSAARLPMEALTAVYELARFSLRPLQPADAERAEADARAAAYGLQVALAERRRRAGQQVPPDPGLRWTAPRGMRGRRP